MSSNIDDDIFHDIIMGEEKCQTAGFQAGYETGQQSGYDEGYKLGWQKGSSIASEVGFYHGFTEELQKKISDDASKTRVFKVTESLLKLIRDLTLDDPTNPLLFEKLENIRSKFKQKSKIATTADLVQPYQKSVQKSLFSEMGDTVERKLISNIHKFKIASTQT